MERVGGTGADCRDKTRRGMKRTAEAGSRDQPLGVSRGKGETRRAARRGAQRKAR